MKLYLAPLQTYTDFHFRNSFQQLYNGVDRFYSPYLRLNNDGSIKESTKLDILPKNNPKKTVVPQLMASTIEDFQKLETYIHSLGYTELNWNMGCPYPMVTNKCLGAGLLNQPFTLLNLFEQVFSQSKLKIGIKMRMGIASTDEIEALIPILNLFPFTEVIIHARYANQLYTGHADVQQFAKIQPLIQSEIVYNGDVKSIQDLSQLQLKLQNNCSLMIGRGALQNPGIFEEIHLNQNHSETIKIKRLETFSQYLQDSISQSHADRGYVLSRLKGHWEYFCLDLSMGKQLYRQLKKAKTLVEFMGYIEAYV